MLRLIRLNKFLLKKRISNFSTKSNLPFWSSNPWLFGGGGGIVGIGIAIYLYKYFTKKSITNNNEIQITPATNAKKLIESQSLKQISDTENILTWGLPDLPGYVQYLLIGGGTAANSCAEQILKNDSSAKILIVTDEDYPPYRRPPLSKYLWNSDRNDLISNLKYAFGSDEYAIFYKPISSYSLPNQLIADSPNTQLVSVATGKSVVSLDSENKLAKLDDGWEIYFDKCLIATGGRPRMLSLLYKDSLKDKVSTYRNAKDFLSLTEKIKDKDVLIVGGGFLGSELAVSLGQKKSRNLCGNVTQIFPESGNMGLVFPSDLANWATEKVRKEGVTVYPGAYITGVFPFNNRLHIVSSNGDEIVTDNIVLTVGLEANTQLAKSAQLETDPVNGGYKVNQEMQVRSDIYAAGDVSSFYDPLLGRRRIEHHDHACVTGAIAGNNMSNPDLRSIYTHQSMFWSDIGPDIGYEAIGLCDSKLPTVSFWRINGFAKSNIAEHDNYGKGFVLYFKEGIISGIIAMNLKNRIPAAREILAGRYDEEDMEDVVRKLKLFDES